MRPLQFIALIILYASLGFAQISSSFTEPPVDQGDFYRTYYLGQTVHITWNESAGLWPTVNLRVGPAFIWNTSYAVLLSMRTLKIIHVIAVLLG